MRATTAFSPAVRVASDGPVLQDGSDSPRQRQRGGRARPIRALASAVALAGLMALAACGPQRQPGMLGYVEGFAGTVVADEPRAAVIARDILSAGGSAADAAVALGLALTVTLPSSAGLGGGGVCLVVDRDTEDDLRVETLDFLPSAPAGPPGPDGAMAVPAVPRGLFALHARAGAMRWESLVAPAENLARFGVPASRALAAELRALGGAPPDMLGGVGPTVAEGQRIQTLDLARALGQVRVGPGEYYEGAVAREIVEAAALQGLTVTPEALRDWRPTWREVIRADFGSHLDAIAPVPDGAADFARVWAAVDDIEDLPRARRAGGALPDLSESLRGRGATAFAVADSYGGAVVCGLTLNRAFGTGRPLAGLGFAPAPMPDARSPGMALLVRVNTNSKIVLGAVAAAGGGAVDAALEGGISALKDGARAAEALSVVSAGGLGRALVNLVSCPGGLPRAPDSCSVAVDPRGAGLGLQVGE